MFILLIRTISEDFKWHWTSLRNRDLGPGEEPESTSSVVYEKQRWHMWQCDGSMTLADLTRQGSPSKSQKSECCQWHWVTKLKIWLDWRMLWTGRLRKVQKGKGQFAQEHMRTHRERERQWMTSVKSEYMMISASADGYKMTLCINYRRGSTPKPPCCHVSQKNSLGTTCNSPEN